MIQGVKFFDVKSSACGGADEVLTLQSLTVSELRRQVLDD